MTQYFDLTMAAQFLNRPDLNSGHDEMEGECVAARHGSGNLRVPTNQSAHLSPFLAESDISKRMQRAL